MLHALYRTGSISALAARLEAAAWKRSLCSVTEASAMSIRLPRTLTELLAFLHHDFSTRTSVQPNQSLAGNAGSPGRPGCSIERVEREVARGNRDAVCLRTFHRSWNKQWRALAHYR